MRHIVTHLFFIVCMFFGYVLALKLFRNNQAIACLAFITLVYHPRLYGQSFINTKDIPAMCTMVLCMAAILHAYSKQKILPWILCGLVLGYSASIRLMNVIIIVPVVLFLLIDIINTHYRKLRITTLRNTAIFLTCFCLSVYICWPTLWGHPVTNAIDAYHSLSHFRWDGNVLFQGNIISARILPWNYIITWFCITTPVVWLIIGFTGIGLVTVNMFRQYRQFFFAADKRILLICLFCFIVPLVTVVKLHAVLYDDWRHLYFIYPFFVVMLLYVIDSLRKATHRITVYGLYLLQFIFALAFMVQAHPYEHLYFNDCISHKKDVLLPQYELDYWGTAGKQGLEWILANSAADTIIINNTAILKYNLMLMTADKRKRFVLSDADAEMDYYIESFRTAPYFYPESKSCYQVIVGNNTILRIVKLK